MTRWANRESSKQKKKLVQLIQLANKRSSPSQLMDSKNQKKEQEQKKLDSFVKQHDINQLELEV